MSETPTLVIAHYDKELLTVYRSELEAEGFRVQATSSGPDVLKRLDSQSPNALILDALLPKQNGLTVLKTVKSDPRWAQIPVIVLLDDGDTYTENRALLCGADGILKRNADGELSDGSLAAKVKSLLNEQELNPGAKTGSPQTPEGLEQILDSAQQHLRHENPILAHITDSLTGLFNSDYGDIKLAEEFKRSRRFGHPLSVVDIQLRLGDGGEERDQDPDWRHILNEVAGLLLCESRDIDILLRIDSRTFRLLLPHTATKGGVAMTERILTNIADRKLGDPESGAIVSASAGLAEYAGEDLETGEELVRRTTEALRQAWRQGGSCHLIWAPDLGGSST